MKTAEDSAEVAGFPEAAVGGDLLDRSFSPLKHAQRHAHAQFHDVFVGGFSAARPEYPAEVTAAVSGEFRQFVH